MPRADRRHQRPAIDPGKLADEPHYDGIFVLRTNARITPLQAVLRYRDLLQIENLFRRAEAVLPTRPIYHSSDADPRPRLLLVPMLQKELADRWVALPLNGRSAARSRCWPSGGQHR